MDGGTGFQKERVVRENVKDTRVTECGKKQNGDAIQFTTDHIILSCPDIVLTLQKVYSCVHIYKFLQWKHIDLLVNSDY